MGDFFLSAGQLSALHHWWDEVDASSVWQDRIYHALAVAYAAIALVALVQLIRIQLRVPEYGWTTQKVFHLLNFLVNTVRALTFAFRRQVQTLEPKILTAVILDLPGVLFFTTYTLLVLFWAEIYHQARSLPTENLRPSFLLSNAAVFAVQGGIWIYMYFQPGVHAAAVASKLFFGVVSLMAALGFVLYGGRLFLMLRRFPIESKGRRKKLREVGCVTIICFSCFIIRAVMIIWSAFSKPMDVDVLNHPVLNAAYYTLVEIVPSALVLFILRKLPPRRASNQYHTIR